VALWPRRAATTRLVVGELQPRDSAEARQVRQLQRGYHGQPAAVAAVARHAPHNTHDTQDMHSTHATRPTRPPSSRRAHDTTLHQQTTHAPRSAGCRAAPGPAGSP
jgi:hypothetical protein